jgi:hypothetical protein
MPNLATTVLAVSIVKAQVPVPPHAPDQPTKVEVPSGVAVSVTAVPVARPTEQVLPQLIPPVEDVTVPLPPPLLLTPSAYWTTVKLAVAVLAASMVTTQVPVPPHAPASMVTAQVPVSPHAPASMVTAQVPVPPHAPDQPANVDVPSGVAVRVTKVSAA